MPPKHHIFICTNQRPAGHPRGCCSDKSGMHIFYAFLEEMGKRMMHNDCFISETKCMGPCLMGTAVVVYPDAVWYSIQSPEAAKEIFESHILNGQPVDKYRMPEEALQLMPTPPPGGGIAFGR